MPVALSILLSTPERKPPPPCSTRSRVRRAWTSTATGRWAASLPPPEAPSPGTPPRATNPPRRLTIVRALAACAHLPFAAPQERHATGCYVLDVSLEGVR